jgi:choice-of-anchor B domain-containing protein
VGYSNTSYTHQGWLTENHTYFIAGDELDEVDFGNNTKTLIFDLTDLDTPLFHFQYLAGNSSIDHNGYVKGNTFYLASYTGGMRTFDITNIENSEMIENGFFDVHPGDNNANFDGAWSVYPYFASGNIIISDMFSGLFIVKKQ